MYLTNELFSRIHLSMSVTKVKFLGIEVLDGNIYIATFNNFGGIKDRFYIRPNTSSTIRSAMKQRLKRFANVNSFIMLYAVYDSKCEHCKRRVQGEIDTHLNRNKELF